MKSSAEFLADILLTIG